MPSFTWPVSGSDPGLVPVAGPAASTTQFKSESDIHTLYDVSAQIQPSISSSLIHSLHASGNINVRRGPEKTLYNRLITGQAYASEVGQTPEAITSSSIRNYVSTSSLVVTGTAGDGPVQPVLEMFGIPVSSSVVYRIRSAGANASNFDNINSSQVFDWSPDDGTTWVTSSLISRGRMMLSGTGLTLWAPDGFYNSPYQWRFHTFAASSAPFTGSQVVNPPSGSAAPANLILAGTPATDALVRVYCLSGSNTYPANPPPQILWEIYFGNETVEGIRGVTGYDGVHYTGTFLTGPISLSGTGLTAFFPSGPIPTATTWSFTMEPPASSSYGPLLATPPSWTQANIGKKHGFVISPLSSSDHIASRLNTFVSGTQALEKSPVPASGTLHYSKASRLVRKVYKLAATSGSAIVPGNERSPSTIENVARSTWDPVSGSFRANSYYNPSVFEITVPDHGKIRDVKVWVEFIHDIRGGQGPLPVSGTHWVGGTGDNTYYDRSGLQSVQVALRSPNVRFPSAHPLWNDPKVSGYQKRPDPHLTGSSNQFGDKYQRVPELLRSSYLLWAGHKVEQDLGMSLGSLTGSSSDNELSGTLVTSSLNAVFAWNAKTETAVDRVGNFGAFTQLQGNVDTTNFSYYLTTGSSGLHIEDTNLACFDAHVGSNLVYDATNTPTFLRYGSPDGSGYALVWRRQSAGTWTSSSLGAMGIPFSPARDPGLATIVCDKSGYLHAFWPYSDASIVYAKAVLSGSGWKVMGGIQTLDSTIGTGVVPSWISGSLNGMCSFTDASDSPNLIYSDFKGNLKWGRQVSGSWTVSTILSSSMISGENYYVHPAAAVGADGTIKLVYSKGTVPVASDSISPAGQGGRAAPPPQGHRGA